MWPILESNKICASCGYDPAWEYEIYPTLERIPENTASFSARRLNWESKDTAKLQEGRNRTGKTAENAAKSIFHAVKKGKDAAHQKQTKKALDNTERPDESVNSDIDKNGKGQPEVVNKGIIIGIIAALIIGISIFFLRPEKIPGPDTGESSALQSESESVHNRSEETQIETELVQSESKTARSESETSQSKSETVKHENETEQSKKQKTETETETVVTMQDKEETELIAQSESSKEEEYTSEKIKEIAKNVWLGKGEWNGDPNSECGFYEGETLGECGFLMYSDNGKVYKSSFNDGTAAIEESDIDLGSKLIGQPVLAQKYTWTEKSPDGKILNSVLYIARADDGSILIMDQDDEDEHYYHLYEGNISDYIKIHEDLVEKYNRLRNLFL